LHIDNIFHYGDIGNINDKLVQLIYINTTANLNSNGSYIFGTLIGFTNGKVSQDNVEFAIVIIHGCSVNYTIRDVKTSSAGIVADFSTVVTGNMNTDILIGYK
jgi:hypothetical protein